MEFKTKINSRDPAAIGYMSAHLDRRTVFVGNKQEPFLITAYEENLSEGTIVFTLKSFPKVL